MGNVVNLLVSRDVDHGTPKREIFRKSMDERLPWLLVQFYAWGFQILQSLGQTTPNHVVSTGHSSRGPNIGVLLLRFGWRLEAANKKPFQSAWAAKPFGSIWYQILSCGFGGQGR